MDDQHWQFWIDVGGTFTDCIAASPTGTVHRVKVLSSSDFVGTVGDGSSPSVIVDPARCRCPPDFWVGYQIDFGALSEVRRVAAFDHQAGALGLDVPLSDRVKPGTMYRLRSDEEAPLLAIRYMLGLRRDQPIPPSLIRCGTTRGTNALLTGTGARTALAITRGFADLPTIGDQTRPDLFQLTIRRPLPIHEAVIEIDERIAVDGTVLQALSPELVLGQLSDLHKQGIHSLAICLLNAYAWPAHEIQIERLARQFGFREITRSSAIAPAIKIVPRCETTVADAYLNPVLREYIAGIQRALGPDTELRLMTSSGGLHGPTTFRGRDSLFSGPAGGVVGMARVADAVGIRQAIGYDMGGTSTDVSRYDGTFEYRFESRHHGLRIAAPSLAIETIAAGGGSICRFDGVRLTVGPESAGANPGPACYGRNGPLTITDANLYLGRILAEHFPFPLDTNATVERLWQLAEEVRQATGRDLPLSDLAEGCIRVANAHMARAVETVSLCKGCDPREYSLIPFGGAAPQHACAIADLLGIRQIVIHRNAGLLSAQGIGLAEVSFHDATGLMRPLNEQSIREAESALARMQERLLDQLVKEGIPRSSARVEHAIDLRYHGQESVLTIPWPADGNVPGAFHAEHRRLYGYDETHRALDMVAARVRASGELTPRMPAATRADTRTPQSENLAEVWMGGQAVTVPVFRWDALGAGDQVSGPAIIAEDYATTVVDPGWRAEMLTHDHLLVNRHTDVNPASASDIDLVSVEIFHHAFMGIAEQMGTTLQRTATSVNVKERLDFSCALFTATGELVANAPHVPVHLGAMGESVRAILQDHPDLVPGDVLVTNDPYRGGSHLPDVTVVTPVFDEAECRLLCCVASRAHHAEIGGISPGSMPPHSRCLAEEGVLIRSMKVVEAGNSKLDDLKQLLASAPYPSRAVADNLADVSAQIAANRQGALKFLRLVEHHGRHQVLSYMGHVQDVTAKELRRELGLLKPGRRRYVDYLDDGSAIAVSADVSATGATIDFEGSAPVHPGNLNANRAIVRAAVIYVLRCLIAEDIPLNDGILQVVQLSVPPGILSPPDLGDARRCAAVAGGNVETSQRIVDVLLGAFGLAAASQGTMNNIVFGDESFGYYETIGGGAGATAVGPGADAVHTHMTNTRMTDPEILEQRYPIRVLELAIRPGSGGAGRHRGGHGIIRKLEFLRPVDLSILTQRRVIAPYGLAGGLPGARGRNTIRRSDGTIEELAGIVSTRLECGDILIIETPGGGGWGSAG